MSLGDIAVNVSTPTAARGAHLDWSPLINLVTDCSSVVTRGVLYGPGYYAN